MRGERERESSSSTKKEKKIAGKEEITKVFKTQQVFAAVVAAAAVDVKIVVVKALQPSCVRA